MIIKARHNKLYICFFQTLFEILARLHFKKVNIVSDLKVEEGPVLLIANHFSWWDGFLAQKVSRNALKRKFYVMMLEEELKKRKFLRKTGAFSIKKGDRTALNSISYAADVLNGNKNMLLLFPQGRFQSSHRYPLKFDNGWSKIFEQVKKRVQVVFMASLVDYFEHRKPTVNIYLEKAFTVEGGNGNIPDGPEIESEYNKFLKRAIDLQDK